MDQISSTQWVLISIVVLIFLFVLARGIFRSGTRDEPIARLPVAHPPVFPIRVPPNTERALERSVKEATTRPRETLKTGQQNTADPGDDGFAESLMLGMATGVPIGRNPAGALLGAAMHVDTDEASKHSSADQPAPESRESSSGSSDSGNSSSDSGGSSYDSGSSSYDSGGGGSGGGGGGGD